MNNIAVLDSQSYAILQNQANHIGEISGDNHSHHSAADNVQAFGALVMLPGMLATILQGQSVMASFDMRPFLSAPAVGREKIDSEQKNDLMNLISTIKGRDINILERAATLAATMFNTPASQLNNISSTTNGNKTLPVSTPSTASTTNAIHARTPVAGGTDITATDEPGHRYVNMIGDLKAVELNNLLTVILTKQETEFNKSSAMSSLRAVDAAERSGNKGIDAEKQRMARDITSGTIGIAGQGVTTARTTKALKAESKSISNNLTAATKVETQQMLHQASIASSTDGLLHKGVPLNESVSAAMNSGTPITSGFSAVKRHDHNQIQLNTNKTKVTSDYANAVIHSGQKIIEGGFNTAAANETKQADLARTDQTVNNDIANAHQLTAKKSAESRAALNQALENMLNSKNSTLSSIAGGMR